MSSMDTSTIQPPLDYSDSGLGILITINILALITTIVVTLRFWARSLTRQAIGADDYLSVRVGCKILGSMCVMWCIAVMIINLTQCQPLKAFWFVELQALSTTKCLDTILCFLGNSIVNCIIDFFTLTLPIHEVVKLQTTTRRKINICIVFLLGSVAFAASLVRTVSTALIWQEGITNFTKQFVVSGTATVVEIYVAIIGASLPTLVPVYRKLRYGDPLKSHTDAISRDTPLRGGSSARKKEFGNVDGSFERLDNSEDALTLGTHLNNHRVKVSSPRGDNGPTYMSSETYPMEGIMVRHDLVWSEQSKSHSIV
ncbi:hypothetical protein J7T55_010464 [Diaporthe amygdali]|uniref:uncharacterized protein n=1 Tax=Phomopsis amygdali TaxID=1214568 RepID=UPI0022FDC0CD|nr:uncharacterized protein J7T55_010464 [Diaporthe amygdali]KAJ0115641.1 hypothetical protein J7T55_010464 [Diaporthe amygdali]